MKTHIIWMHTVLYRYNREHAVSISISVVPFKGSLHHPLETLSAQVFAVGSVPPLFLFPVYRMKTLLIGGKMSYKIGRELTRGMKKEVLRATTTIRSGRRWIRMFPQNEVPPLCGVLPPCSFFKLIIHICIFFGIIN